MKKLILLLFLFFFKFAIPVFGLEYEPERPYKAKKVGNGNIVISDSQSEKIVEIFPDGEIVWQIRMADKEEFLELQNGGFEEVENEIPINWFPMDFLAENKGNFSIDSQVRRSGKTSARIDYRGMGYVFWTQKVKVEAGKNYHFFGWIKTELDWEERNWARYELWWEDEDGNLIKNPLFSDRKLGNTGWMEAKWSGQAPKGAVTVNIRAIMTGKGSVWFDDVIFEEKKIRIKNIIFFLLGLGVSFIFFLFAKKKNLFKKFKFSSFYKTLVKIWIACYIGKED